MYEQILKTVVAFNNLPETDEIKEVKRQYLNYEISAFDFFCIADSYLDDQPCSITPMPKICTPTHWQELPPDPPCLVEHPL